MVGDPGGRSEERNLLDDDTLASNVAAIKEQISRIVDFEPGVAASSSTTATGRQPITLLEFLRDVGKHVTVNQMIARDSVKNRLASEHGISYTEFSYMLLQANDYLWLHDHHDCQLQVGGADQWGNLVSGVDLIRRASWRPGARARVAAAARCRRLASSARRPVRRTVARRRQDQSRTSSTSTSCTSSDAEVVAATADALAPPAGRRRGSCCPNTPPHPRSASRSAPSPTRSPRSCTERRLRPRPREAADVLFGGDPLTASEAAIRAIAGEVPTTRPERASDWSTRSTCSSTTGLACVEERSAPPVRSGRGFGRTACSSARTPWSATWACSTSRFLLLRKGKSTYHLVEISSRGG